MKNFKVEVSKGQEKFTFIRKAENELDLRAELHKEKFTILSILWVEEAEVLGSKFFFEIEDKGKVRVGTIASTDIFKSYLKIKVELGYNIVSIYSDKDTSDSEKRKIMHDLDEQYLIYLEANKKKIKEKEVVAEKNKAIMQVVEDNIDNFHMKKELQEVYKVLDKVLVKIKFFLEWDGYQEYINATRKTKLQEIYYSILKVRTSNNVVKLRVIWELALKKVWEIELEILENQKDQQYRILLKETNSLLKKLGSRDSFVEKDRDIKVIATRFIEYLKDLSSGKLLKKRKVEMDVTSNAYLKTKLLYNNYHKKLKSLDAEISKDFIVFILPTEKNNEKKLEYMIRRRVLKQNLLLLHARLTGKTISITKIVKGYQYFAERFVASLKFFQTPFVVVTLCYSLVFLFIQVGVYVGLFQTGVNFYGLLYFLYINLAFILLQFTRWLGTFIFNVVILSFVFIVGTINF